MCSRSRTDRPFLHALRWALAGLRAGWSREPHFRWHVVLALWALSVAALASPSALEWGVLVASCIAVLVVQLLNMVTELTLDVVVSEYHPLVRSAKDAAAGAVLLTVSASVLVFALILGPSLVQMWTELRRIWLHRPAALWFWAATVLLISWISLAPPSKSGG